MPGAVKRLWRGETPLSEAFWTWAVLGGLLVNASTTGLSLLLLSHDLPILALAGSYVPSVPYNILVIVGVWRAADRHTGDRTFAETARVLVVVALSLLTVT